jgi:16S rRNA (guanine527-N7)-methyltransferase
VFGAALPVAVRYADLLVGAGVDRGLIGPRESDRIWERHLLNCAVVAEGIPEGAAVCDVGSGAGLPGLAVALARPDLSVLLVEPLERRAEFLQEAVETLGLEQVRVVRARAEELDPQTADVVTARAVAPLGKLARWCLPLVRSGGTLLALKGARAAAELAAAESVLRRTGATAWRIRQMGLDVLEHPTTVVVVTAGEAAARTTRATGAGAARGRR